MEKIMDFEELNKELHHIILGISSLLGEPIHKETFKIINKAKPHRAEPLPIGKMGIYMFLYKDRFLKIGKAGSKSNARFYSQHYNPKSARSNLAASILSERLIYVENITESNIGDWIKENCNTILTITL